MYTDSVQAYQVTGPCNTFPEVPSSGWCLVAFATHIAFLNA